MSNWRSLGIITPTIGGWETFPDVTLGGETFRVSFLGLGVNPDSRIWTTFAVVDCLYITGPDTMSGSSVKVWPSSMKEIVILPIPPELKQVGWVVRSVRVRKFSRFRLGRASEPAWGIEIEEFFP